MGVRNIIVSSVVIILILIVFMNMAVFVHGMTVRSAIRDTVYTYIEEARQEGYFTNTIINNLKSDIVSISKCDSSDIIYTVTTTPKYRTPSFDTRELIEYDIAVPYQLFIGHEIYTRVEGKVPSERQ